MKRLVLALAIAAAAASGGCVAEGCPAALLTGVLIEQTGELVVMPDGGGAPVRVLWPSGHALRRDADTLVLVNVFGLVVAREGDAVRLGGGHDSRQGDAFAVCGSFEVVR